MKKAVKYELHACTRRRGLGAICRRLAVHLPTLAGRRGEPGHPSGHRSGAGSGRLSQPRRSATVPFYRRRTQGQLGVMGGHKYFLGGKMLLQGPL